MEPARSPTFADVKPFERREARTARQKARERFRRARQAETWYGRALRKIAAQIEALVRGFDLEDSDGAARLVGILDRYSTIIEPWAESVANRMIAEVAQRDAKAWAELGKSMGHSLRHEIATAPTGTAMREALARQVDLITSLPREAAERVHGLTREALLSGRRAADIAEEIAATGEITLNRATTIARTETSRTSTELTSARAQHIGSPGYIWRTAKDKDVRPLHRRLEGQFFTWQEPPITGSNGERSHPGGIYNCRCYPEPVIPEHFLMAA